MRRNNTSRDSKSFKKNWLIFEGEKSFNNFEGYGGEYLILDVGVSIIKFEPRYDRLVEITIYPGLKLENLNLGGSLNKTIPYNQSSYLKILKPRSFTSLINDNSKQIKTIIENIKKNIENLHKEQTECTAEYVIKNLMKNILQMRRRCVDHSKHHNIFQNFLGEGQAWSTI